MSKHNGYKGRLLWEIRNGDGNIYRMPIGKRLPKLRDVNPLKIQEAVEQMIVDIKEPLIEELTEMHSTGHEEPHHD